MYVYVYMCVCVCVCVCERERNGVGEAQSGIAPCENDLLPVSPLSNGLLFSDVWRREGEVLRGVWGGEVDVARLNEG